MILSASGRRPHKLTNGGQIAGCSLVSSYLRDQGNGFTGQQHV
jgi:hypothetical protein